MNKRLHSVSAGVFHLLRDMAVVCFVCVYFQVGDEAEMLCPPPDPKKMIIENLEKHLGITFTEEEMDYWFEKGDADLFLEEIRRRQKRHHPSTVKNREKAYHPSVKLIPASK